jgi:hypothetical protein
MQVGRKLEMTSFFINLTDVNEAFSRFEPVQDQIITAKWFFRRAAVTKALSRPLGERNALHEAGRVLCCALSRAQLAARPGKPRSACLHLCTQRQSSGSLTRRVG